MLVEPKQLLRFPYKKGLFRRISKMSYGKGCLEGFWKCLMERVVWKVSENVLWKGLFGRFLRMSVRQPEKRWFEISIEKRLYQFRSKLVVVKVVSVEAENCCDFLMERVVSKDFENVCTTDYGGSICKYCVIGSR